MYKTDLYPKNPKFQKPRNYFSSIKTSSFINNISSKNLKIKSVHIPHPPYPKYHQDHR